MFDEYLVQADGSARRLLEEQGFEQEGRAFRLRRNGPLWVRMVAERAEPEAVRRFRVIETWAEYDTVYRHPVTGPLPREEAEAEARSLREEGEPGVAYTLEEVPE